MESVSANITTFCKPVGKVLGKKWDFEIKTGT
jgi:hypothetical protein